MTTTPLIAQDNIDIITVTAPATISSGDTVEIGANLRGIAISDAASGDPVAIQRSGLAKDVTKAAPLVITAGDLLYWSDSGDEVTKTDTDKPFGIAYADAGSAAVLVDVLLNAGSFSPAATGSIYYNKMVSDTISVDLAALASTTFTLPGAAGFQWIPRRAVFQCTDSTALNGDAVVNFGTSAGGQEIMADFPLTNFDTKQQTFIVSFDGLFAQILGNSATVEIEVTTADTGGTGTADLYIEGDYIAIAP